MSYKWQRKDWGCELGENERIIDWSFLAELNFTLAALLTSKGGVLIYSKVGNSGVKICVTHLEKFAPNVNEAAAVCILPNASGLAFIFSRGSVLLVPLGCILDVPWGRCDILANGSISILEVNSVEEGCLCIPTCALCYTAKHSNRPYLIYANKAGQLFIIDLTMMVVSVMLRAPESIHNIALFANKGDVHLLVSGFTGEQWILPLETNGRGLRETLGQVIPWDLREHSYKKSQISVTFDGMLAVLSTEDCVVKLYDDIDMKTVKNSFCVPENTWQMYIFPYTIFAVTDEVSGARVSVNFGGLFSSMKVFYEKVLDFANKKVLGFVPILYENILPSCLLVMEQDVIVLSPNKSLREILVDYVAKLDYSYNSCVLVAETFGISIADLVQNVLDDTVTASQNSVDREIFLNKLIHLALDSSMDIITLIQWCTANNCGHALVEVVRDICAENPNEEGRHYMIDLCMARYKVCCQDKNKIEAILNEFLVQHPDVHIGMERLLEANFWSTVAIIVDNSLDKAEIVGRYLARTERKWPTVYSSFIVKILSSLCWKSCNKEDGELLLHRMTEFLAHVRSLPHLATFAKIGVEQLTWYQHDAAVLYVLSTLRLMQSTCTYLPSAEHSIISSGSNLIVAVTSEEGVGYWGEFSPGSFKSKECKKHCGQRVSRLCILDVPVRICSVSCGTEHLLCLAMNGTVYAFGRNRFGQCGVGHTNEITVATEVVNNYGSARTICAGHYHSALINEKGYAFTWGWSLHGQLGTYTCCSFINVLTPNRVKSLNGRVISISCGYAHTLFLMESGVVYSCGNGSYGQLGAGTEIKKRFEPEAVPVLDKVIMIASKYFHCLAVSEVQKIYCWGANPQALKMKMFVKRRLRVETDKSTLVGGKRHGKEVINNDHLSVTGLEHTVKGRIIHIDAGYNHSALINEHNNLYTWGKSLDMQLGHGNKKEQEEPHQVFEPADAAWNFVSCGYDFTAAVTSKGSVYVWGRNYKGHLGVESGVSSSNSRKIVFKTAKGPSRTIEVAADSPCIPRPTKFPSLVAFALTEICLNELRKRSFIDFVKKMDFDVISNISYQLLKNPVYCLPAVYVHLLAGDLINAIECLVQIPPKAIEAITDNNNEQEGSELFELIDVVWDLLCKHPSFTAQSKALSDLSSMYTIGDRIVKSKKLSALASLLLISKPGLITSLNSHFLEILEKWQPDSFLQSLHVAQNSVQNFSGKVCYWTCCGVVEKCPMMVSSIKVGDKKGVCPRCCEKWSCSVRAKFLE